MTRHWTTREDGWTNAAPEFQFLCEEVERLIRDSAHMLIGGYAGNVARLIMSQLAHVHHLAPTKDTK